MLPKNPIVSVDVGQHECWSAQSLHLKGQKGRILIGGGYGCMGCGLPWAIGGSVSLKAEGKDNTVYCIVGDGGLQMNIQEFETVAREKLPIKILVMNNKVLGKIWSYCQLLWIEKSVFFIRQPSFVHRPQKLYFWRQVQVV